MELVAGLNPVLEFLFKLPPVLYANCLTHGMKVCFDETVQVFGELRPESGADSEQGDYLVKLVLRQFPVERLRSIVKNMIPVSNLFHEMGHAVLCPGKLFEA